MQFWEYVAREDRATDLSDPGRAARYWEWLANPCGEWPFVWPADGGRPGGHPAEIRLHRQAAALWSEAVHATRSVALRLKGFVGRPSAVSPEQADETFAMYLGRLTPVVLVRGR